jgi:ubiquinone/menaquinone biosynthesis C-methylase UbiE
MAHFAPGEIRRYYDRNTSAFVAFGQGGGAGAIHRAIWGPGVRTRAQAFRYAEDRIAEHIRRLPLDVDVPHIVDLGCGVGASICYLAEIVPTITATGITISPVQAQFAKDRIARMRLSGRVTCIEGDFSALPAEVRAADLAYAIESFVHAPSPEQFLDQCRMLVREGGVLILCDDFKRATASTSSPAASAVDRFRRGWHINTLVTSDELREMAAHAGFEHHSTTDLTHYLELNRPRDRVVSALLPLLGWLPLQATRFGHLLGGSALQKCLDNRWIGYDLVVFQRVVG